MLPRLLLPLHPFAGRLVVVGVSGGADSVALLRALVQVGAQPVAAHFDHALRADSEQDARWVQALAASLGVPFQMARVDVRAVAQRRGWNLEDAGRRLRYDFLTRVAKQTQASAILTAHTRRDQAETVLSRLLRGEATLTGIPAGRGRIHRPWLHIPRPEIESFLRELGQDWREDPTNTDTHYNRAWIRQEVVPLLTARYPALEEALARLANLSGQDDEALQQLAESLQPHTPLARETPAVLRRWVAGQLRSAGLSFHGPQLEGMVDAIRQGETAHFTLPENRQVCVTGAKLFVQPQPWPAPDFPIPDGWALRRRQDGDRIHLPGGTRKVSDVLTDAKVPRSDRNTVPLLVNAAGRVQWIGLNPPVWAVGAREQAHVPADPLDTAMQEALRLAREAAAQGEVPVGAVVLHASGEIVGRGYNTSRKDGDMTRHAELQAIHEATRAQGAYLMDCTLVVTLEPCPMCLGAALEARIGRIVYGASNPKAGALGGVADLLRAHWGHKLEVMGGYRAKEAAKLLHESFEKLRRGL